MPFDVFRRFVPVQILLSSPFLQYQNLVTGIIEDSSAQGSDSTISPDPQSYSKTPEWEESVGLKWRLTREIALNVEV
jgi:hypothetical protein